VQAALAHVEDLLALEQRVHDDGPFLQRGRHVLTIGGYKFGRLRKLRLRRRPGGEATPNAYGRHDPVG
jgi:hypothetical protein